MQCTALHRTALHCTALHCTALHCTEKHGTALHCTALHCTALHCTERHGTALHYTALHSSALYFINPAWPLNLCTTCWMFSLLNTPSLPQTIESHFGGQYSFLQTLCLQHCTVVFAASHSYLLSQLPSCEKPRWLTILLGWIAYHKQLCHWVISHFYVSASIEKVTEKKIFLC